MSGESATCRSYSCWSFFNRLFSSAHFRSVQKMRERSSFDLPAGFSQPICGIFKQSDLSIRPQTRQLTRLFLRP